MPVTNVYSVSERSSTESYCVLCLCPFSQAFIIWSLPSFTPFSSVVLMFYSLTAAVSMIAPAYAEL